MDITNLQHSSWEIRNDADKDNMVYQLPGKITVGESTLDDVLDAYGDPDAIIMSTE